MPQYVELHAQSAFSFLEGASSPEQLALGCANLEMSAMALTDANGVYGSARFHYTARKIGIKPMVGAEVELEAQVRLPTIIELSWELFSGGMAVFSITRTPETATARMRHRCLTSTRA